MATPDPSDLDQFTRGSNNNDLIVDRNGGDDYIKGETGTDRIHGGIGGDVLDGSNGNDNLTGGTGDDILLGGAGNDILTGDAGNDVFQGGYGADQFRITTFNYSGAEDVITDFRLSQNDSLRLLSGVHITDAVRGSSDYMATDAQVDKFGVDQNHPQADDLILTVTSVTGASQTVVLLDVFAHGETNATWDAYLSSLGYQGHIA